MRDCIMKTERLKKILEIPYLDVCINNFKGDLWMISENLSDYSSDFVIKESKLESSRKIYSGPKSDCDLYEAINDLPFMMLMKSVLIKALVGTGDVVQRNFIMKDNIVYSIDDQYCDNCSINLIPRGSNSFKAQWKSKMVEYIEPIINLIDKWDNTLPDEFHIRLEMIKIELQKEIENIR